MSDADAATESDHELVFLAQKGERDAYDRLMLRHQDGVARHMRRFSRKREEVEDLTQTVFVKAYRGLASYKPTAPFANWLTVIANRVGYEHWRREGKRIRAVSYHGNEEMLAEKEEPPDRSDERFERLAGVMDRLKPAERQILYLLYVDGLSVAEAAGQMGWNQAVTKMRAYRARIKLRKILGVQVVPPDPASGEGSD